jgi:hypothetical protein
MTADLGALIVRAQAIRDAPEFSRLDRRQRLELRDTLVELEIAAVRARRWAEIIEEIEAEIDGERALDRVLECEADDRPDEALAHACLPRLRDPQVAEIRSARRTRDRRAPRDGGTGAIDRSEMI